MKSKPNKKLRDNEAASSFSASKFEVAELKGKDVARMMLHDIKPIIGLITLCIIVAVAAVFAIAFTPTYIGRIVDIINIGINSGAIDKNALTSNLVLLACLYIAYALFTMLKIYLLNNVLSRHFNNKLRIRMSEKIMALPVSYVDKTSKGELIERMTDDVSVIGSTIHQIIDLSVTGLLQLVLIIILSFLQDWHMALVIVGMAPLCIGAGMFFSSMSSKHFHAYMKGNGELYSLIEETYSGMKTVRSYGMERFMLDHHAKINGRILRAGRRGYFIVGSLGPMMTFIIAVAFAVVCLVGGAMIAGGVAITLGALIAVVMYAQQLSGPLGSIANSLGMFQRARAASKRIYGMLALPEAEKCDTRAELACNSVEFEHVVFGYDPAEPVLSDFDLKVERGQKIAIVGPTGGGKTTIVNLLMRFYDPDRGRILIDGVDTRTLDRDIVRDCFEMVLQDTWLFSGSIVDNVAYGADNVSRERVEEACRAAYCDTFINTLSDGYDTVVDQGASNISQGQKQLLTIARAFVADRPILILDEATSNVDTRTEILLQRAMDKLMSGRTCFVIAHRLSTIINADKIIVINEGRIIEQGTHKQLMAANGFYADMFNSQYTIV